MYPVAMSPQYGGSHQPILHSSLYSPLISNVNFTTGQSIPHTDRQILNQGTLYDPRQNSASFYVNPLLSDNDRLFRKTGNQNRGIGDNGGSMHTSSNLHDPPYDSYGSNARQKQYFKQLLNEELFQEMIKMNLGYIETEDSPQKMEQRQKLEDKILSFLSVTPHSRKFSYPAVLEILENSVSMSSHFNAHKTACAFDALAQYASNFISQPWRKEFRELKLYSGFWVHQISKYIIGAERILELMGYAPIYSKDPKSQFCGSNMPFLYVHNGIIDPDLIPRLALDCIIAYCECQCLSRIKEGLDSYDVGFSQILEFRQRHVVSGIDAVVRTMKYNLRQSLQNSKQQETHRMKQPSPSPPPLPSRYSSQGSNMHDKLSVKSPSSNSANKYFTTNLHQKQDKPKMRDSSPDCSKAYKNHSRVCSNHENSLRPEWWERAGHSEDKMHSSVPTATLIDLDSPLNGSMRTRQLLPKVINRKSKTLNHDADELALRSSSSSFHKLPPEVLKTATLDEHMKASINHVNNVVNSRNNSRQEKHSSEMWDYVYSDLGKKGYSKDIGDRGDVLNNLKHDNIQNDKCTKGYMNNKKELSIIQALQQYELNESKDKVDGTGPSGKSSGIDKYGASKRASIYDNHSTRPDPTFDDDRPFTKNNDCPSLSEPREYLSAERPKMSRGDINIANSWTCDTCTYINKGKQCCEMCSKSRRYGKEDKPLESGSKECSKCTLINEKVAKICSACNSTLESCSTYI